METPGGGGQFLHGKDSSLHRTPPVEHALRESKNRGETTTQKPADKIHGWMKVLERTHLSHREDPKVLDRIKKYYHKTHIIQPENIIMYPRNWTTC